MAGTYVFNDARRPAPAPSPPPQTTSMEEHNGRDGCAACAAYDKLKARHGIAADFTVLALLHKVYLVWGPGAGGSAQLIFFDKEEVNAPEYRARVIDFIDSYRDELPELQSEWRTKTGSIPAHITMQVRDVIFRAAHKEGDFLEAIDAILGEGNLGAFGNGNARPGANAALPVCAYCLEEIEGEEPVTIHGNLLAHRQCIDEAEAAFNSNNNSGNNSRSRRSRSRRSRSRRSRNNRSRSRRSRSRRSRSHR